MKRASIVAVALCVVASGGVASAQEEPADPEEGGEEDSEAVDVEEPAEPGIYTKDTWPAELTKRPITLPKGMLEIRGEVHVNLSSDQVAKPIAIKPSIYYGVSDKLSVGLIHPVAGLCLAGEENGCAAVYNDVGIDAIFAFMTGNLNVGAHGGIDVISFDPEVELGIRVGVLGKYMAGRLAVLFDPRIYVGATQRDAGNKEFLQVPIEIQFQAIPKLAVFAQTGIEGWVDGFGDTFEVPIGVGALYNINQQLDAGLRFTFDNLAGKNSSADLRSLDILVNFRL